MATLGALRRIVDVARRCADAGMDEFLTSVRTVDSPTIRILQHLPGVAHAMATHERSSWLFRAEPRPRHPQSTYQAVCTFTNTIVSVGNNSFA